MTHSSETEVLSFVMPIIEMHPCYNSNMLLDSANGVRL